MAEKPTTERQRRLIEDLANERGRDVAEIPATLRAADRLIKELMALPPAGAGQSRQGTENPAGPLVGEEARMLGQAAGALRDTAAALEAIACRWPADRADGQRAREVRDGEQYDSGPDAGFGQRPIRRTPREVAAAEAAMDWRESPGDGAGAVRQWRGGRG